MILIQTVLNLIDLNVVNKYLSFTRFGKPIKTIKTSDTNKIKYILLLLHILLIISLIFGLLIIFRGLESVSFERRLGFVEVR